MSANSGGPDKTVQLPRHVRVFVVCFVISTFSSWADTYFASFPMVFKLKCVVLCWCFMALRHF